MNDGNESNPNEDWLPSKRLKKKQITILLYLGNITIKPLIVLGILY